MKDPKTIWAWVGGAIVVIAIVIGLIWHFAGGKPSGATPIAATHAPAGQIVQGFPPSLVLDSAIQVSNSYSINYSASTNQYTAEWVSSSTPSSTFSNYTTYFTQNNWTITNKANTGVMKGINAENGSSTAFVLIFPQGQGSKVTITYVSK